MAKAQAAKSKGSSSSGGIGGWFKGLTASKPKAAPARPAALSSTLTNIQAQTTGGVSPRTGTKPLQAKKPVRAGGEGLARFRMPMIGGRRSRPRSRSSAPSPSCCSSSPGA
jgi:hypothetical protein